MVDVNILLVEDDPAATRLVLEACEESHLDKEVLTVPSGEAALEGLTGHRGEGDLHPDLIILDIDLPGMSGLEIVSEIRDTYDTEYLPIILFSSTAKLDRVVEGYRQGANAYVQKPVDFPRMVRFAEVLNTFWFQLAKLPTESE